MSASKSKDYLTEVIEKGLCTRCGACVGLSNDKINFHDKEGSYLPRIKTPLDDAEADRAWSGCSGRLVDFPKLNKFSFDTDSRHPYLGHVKRLGIVYSNHPDIRRQSASGGLISSVLIWLLRQGRIKGAIVTAMDETTPWLPKTFIAETEADILKAAQSKYVITSVNEVLAEVQQYDGPLAYVGLPCQVHSIRKLQMASDPAVQNIRYIFGPYCGNNLHFTSVKSLLRSYGETDHRKITRLSFREGEWPGSTSIDLKGERTIQLEKFHANYLIPFHMMKRCLLCTDLANEFADLSGGDAWAPRYEERGKGFSLVITRSQKGNELLSEMIADGALAFQELTFDDVLQMHSHGYDLKKRGAFIRLRLRRWSGRRVPDYGYQIKGMNISRYIMELVIDVLFLILMTPAARWLSEQINPSLMGALFKRLRTLWKRVTHSTKRHGLGES